MTSRVLSALLIVAALAYAVIDRHGRERAAGGQETISDRKADRLPLPRPLRGTIAGAEF